jgi:hypothetical protein
MKGLQTDGANMRLQWSAILARKGHFVATRILNCLDGVGDQIESELPDQSSLVCEACRERCGGDIINPEHFADPCSGLVW